MKNMYYESMQSFKDFHNATNLAFSSITPCVLCVCVCVYAFNSMNPSVEIALWTGREDRWADRPTPDVFCPLNWPESSPSTAGNTNSFFSGLGAPDYHDTANTA